LKEMLFSSDGYAKLIGRNANAKGMVGRAPFLQTGSLRSWRSHFFWLHLCSTEKQIPLSGEVVF
jgi:hypothetical protein